MQIRLLACFLIPLLSGSSFMVFGQATGKNPQIETAQFRIRLLPRTPNQIAAFYEARGFPDHALAELRKTCFITIGVHNKSNTILWFDLGTWRIRGPQGEIRRYLRSDWQKRWHELEVPKRLQATFRWTLMPEQLDFRPGESEGGNIILPRTESPMTISGEVYLGEQKKDLYTLNFENIHCATD